MRKSEAPRRSSAFEDLFAERQVYLRSGLTSRYVVLSRPLQIAVTIGVGLIVAGLVFASYRSVVSHLEAGELRRELTLAEARLGELRVARRADGATTGGDAVDPARAGLAESRDHAEQRVAELTRQLEASDAKADRLQGDLEAALADAAALRRAAETAEANLADLQAEMARRRDPPSAEGDASQTLAQIKEPGTPEADAAPALEASLAGREARIATRSDIEDESIPEAAAKATGAADELDRVRAELRAANQRISELEAAIRLGLAKLAPQPAPPAPR